MKILHSNYGKPSNISSCILSIYWGILYHSNILFFLSTQYYIYIIKLIPNYFMFYLIEIEFFYVKFQLFVAIMYKYYWLLYIDHIYCDNIKLITYL